MTRKMVIEELQRHRQEFAHDHGWSGSVLDALDAAIEALQMVHCEDAISRQKALDTVDNLKIVIANNLPELIYKSSVLKLLHELPSVQPEQKEITMEDVKTYCEPRNLVVLTKELFDQMNNNADKIYLYLKDRERR